MSRTIPPLDEEVERLSRQEAYERVRTRNYLGEKYGIRIRCFESGYGEWFEYYRENPDGDGLLYWREGHVVQERPVRDDVLSRIGRNAVMGEDFVRDVSLVPMERMPEWGDGSAHYSCHQCRRPIIEDELEYDDNLRECHESCLP